MDAICIILVLASLGAVNGDEVLLGKGYAPSGDMELQSRNSLSRNRRSVCEMTPTKFGPQEQDVLLKKHNQLRGQLKPSSADEFHLIWDDKLAQRAQAWADKCIFEHDFLTDCDGNGIGQNLYVVFSNHDIPEVNTEDVVQQWFNEHPFYQFSTAECDTGKVCGHYTQVAWAETKRVGCGFAKCPTLVNPGYKNITNGAHVVCTYSPPGNYRGAKPYKSGLPCSECNVQEGGVKCENNLCVPCLPKLDPDCKCPSSGCANGGILNEENCSCQCVEGFYGPTCDKSCEDTSKYCSHWKGYCGQGPYKGFMQNNCAKTCGLC